MPTPLNISPFNHLGALMLHTVATSLQGDLFKRPTCVAYIHFIYIIHLYILYIIQIHVYKIW